MNKIFHTPDEIPKYNKQLLLQYENGSYEQFSYCAMNEAQIERYFKRKHVNLGRVIRWCYIDDLLMI